MGHTCVVSGCTNRANPGQGTTNFYDIPKVIVNQGKETERLSTERRNTWLARINRAGFTPDPAKRHYKVCSDHFVTGKPSALFYVNDQDWAPTLNLGYDKVKQKSEAAKIREVCTKLLEEKQRRSKSATSLLALHKQTANGRPAAENETHENKTKDLQEPPAEGLQDSCCAPGCKNQQGDGNARAFYSLPKDPERRQQWVAVINRARSQQKRNEPWDSSASSVRLCSEHFISGIKNDNPGSPDYVPAIFKHVPSPKKRRLFVVVNRSQMSKCQIIKRARKSPATAAGDDSVTDTANEGSPVEVDIVTRESPEKSPHNKLQSTPDYHASTGTPLCASEDCKRHIQSLESECQALRTENELLKDNIKRIGLNEMLLKNNDENVNFLTGLPTFSLLMTLFHSVAPFLKHKSYLTSFQQFMLTLIKLRLNLSFDFLANYFAVDSTAVSQLFNYCINVIYYRLVPRFVMWPDRESLAKSLPSLFRNSTFEKTVCIIDVLDIFIEESSNLLASAQCYSAYKSCHKMKYLIAICPQGLICFISNGCRGRTSDKFLTEQSNFLCNLLPRDLVLADQGFIAGESEHSYQAGHKITAFALGKGQLEPVDLGDTGCVESLRKHIESIIYIPRQKYTILQTTIPISGTRVDQENGVTLPDKIVNVCCALTNVSKSFVFLQ
ncbi:uncharacterized protein [Nerophis lumbriciformis]|uniref:uncharacterized protein isoform X2 n=1 Tax=Nerophis lumbriciformis TaxID=546530 RepID=UPI002ADF7D03|nr:uncharacterized protein LOC133622454 isoform X2 [Nerophis lumbriciformis]